MPNVLLFSSVEDHWPQGNRGVPSRHFIKISKKCKAMPHIQPQENKKASNNPKDMSLSPSGTGNTASKTCLSLLSYSIFTENSRSRRT